MKLVLLSNARRRWIQVLCKLLPRELIAPAIAIARWHGKQHTTIACGLCVAPPRVGIRILPQLGQNNSKRGGAKRGVTPALRLHAIPKFRPVSAKTISK